jgi:hypothetical protein
MDIHAKNPYSIAHFYAGTDDALGSDMMDVALCILAVIGGSLTVEAFAAASAPLGYQDKDGFHFGADPRKNADDLQSGNPS